VEERRKKLNHDVDHEYRAQGEWKASRNDKGSTENRKQFRLMHEVVC
jgi:hypothetical protein